MDKQTITDISQIAFISNQKTLMAACDYLQTPDPNSDSDKCPASLHARYSRIKLILTDFEKNPSVILTYNLKPSEIRLLYEKIRVLTMTERTFDWSTTKDFSSFGSNHAAVFRMVREPMRNNQKANYPWSVSIRTGTTENGKFKPAQNVRKFLSDDEILKFFIDIVTYLNVWEITHGAPFIRNVIDPYKEQRKKMLWEKKHHNSKNSVPNGSEIEDLD